MTPTGSQTELVLQQALLLPSTAEVELWYWTQWTKMSHISSGKPECPVLDHDSFYWHSVKNDPKTSRAHCQPTPESMCWFFTQNIVPADGNQVKHAGLTSPATLILDPAPGVGIQEGLGLKHKSKLQVVVWVAKERTDPHHRF